MDPEQQAMLQQLRGQYGQGGGFKPTQGMQFGAFQPPQHAPLGGPSLGGQGGGGGGGGAGQQGGGGMGEIAKSLTGMLQQQPKRVATPPGATPLGAPASQAGPPIVGTQAEMGPFQSQMTPPPSGIGRLGPEAAAASPTGIQDGLPRRMGGPMQGPPMPMQGPPMPNPGGEHTMPPAGPMPAGGAAMMQPANGLMRAGTELPDWLWRMPRMAGAMGL